MGFHHRIEHTQEGLKEKRGSSLQLWQVVTMKRMDRTYLTAIEHNQAKQGDLLIDKEGVNIAEIQCVVLQGHACTSCNWSVRFSFYLRPKEGLTFLYKICAQLRMSFDVRYIGPATLQGRGAAQSSQGFQLISPWASFRKAFALLPQPVAGPNLEDTVAKRGAGTTSLGEDLQDVTSCVLQSSIYIPFRFISIHLRSFNH